MSINRDAPLNDYSFSKSSNRRNYVQWIHGCHRYPFNLDGSFDEESFRQLIEFQIENGTDAIIPCGTTGESATLDYDEHERVIKVCVEQVAGRIPVIAGTGSNSTAEAIS